MEEVAAAAVSTVTNQGEQNGTTRTIEQVVAQVPFLILHQQNRAAGNLWPPVPSAVSRTAVKVCRP